MIVNGNGTGIPLTIIPLTEFFCRDFTQRPLSGKGTKAAEAFKTIPLPTIHLPFQIPLPTVGAGYFLRRKNALPPPPTGTVSTLKPFETDIPPLTAVHPLGLFRLVERSSV